MAGKARKEQDIRDDSMKISITKNGPCIATGGIPLIEQEIWNDDQGYCRTWKIARRFPVQQQYALCRCGQSKNKPFCDGTHTKIGFDGTETAGNEPYLHHPRVYRGPEIDLDDYEHLCVHARFCMRSGGIWDLTKQSDDPNAKDTAIEEAWNCPSGRLVIRDHATGKPIEPTLEKSIVLMEYPAKGEHGPLWVRGGIPVVSSNGKPYRVRNRLTLCRCGKSNNKPFCDGTHIRH